ncbi:MAG TPA: ribonuclease T2 [Pseudolabrys sp.]|nr:ribonuclease T2 [Pseudolabrys sp.]
MVGRRAARALQVVALAASLIVITAVVALAQVQDRRQNEPGKFDFYVLALSWSPSFCAATRERAPDRAPDPQCGGRPFAFVVHGLWPQYEQGFPSYCQVPAPRLDRAIVGSALELMPSPRLVFHEWDRHGTCSGLSPRAYFENVRKARAAVKIPADYVELDKPITVTADEVTDAFIKANPGLSRANFAVACDKKRLTEVRVCMSRDFSFRDCPEVTRRACRLDKMAMPAVRGG